MYRDKDQREFARSLRNQPTEAEKRLWHFLRAERLRGHKFGRQAAIGPYIVDFVSFSAKLIVEQSPGKATESRTSRVEYISSPRSRVPPFSGGTPWASFDGYLVADTPLTTARRPNLTPSSAGRATFKPG